MPIWLRNLTFNLIKEYNTSTKTSSEESWVKGPTKEMATEMRKKIHPPVYNTEVSRKWYLSIFIIKYPKWLKK